MPPHQFMNRTIILLLIYFILWTILPVVLASSYPLDVPEGIYWGREWQWGYYKHPPLSSWVLYSFYAIFGQVGPYLLSQICIGLTMWFVYKLGRQLFCPAKAQMGSLLVLAVFYYTWPSLEFNHNIAQMPIWAALIYVFYLASRENKWWQWLSFGILAGAGMLIKYPIAILLITIVLYSLITPYRKLWLSTKPWVAIGLAAAIFAPNVLWLIQHEWLPFTYAQSRSAEAAEGQPRLKAFGFLLTQFINLIPLFLILIANKIRLKTNANIVRSDQFFLLFIGLFPAFFIFAIGLIFGIGIRDMWGSPMWCLSGLILVSFIPEHIFTQKQAALKKGLIIWLILITILMAAYVQFGGQIRNKPSRMDWPQQTLTQHVDQQWQKISHCRLDSTSGADWLAMLVAASSQYSPSVMISGTEKYSPWMNQTRLIQHGTFSLWEKDKPPVIPFWQQLQSNPNFIIQRGTWEIKWEKVPNKAPLTVEWMAFVPKQCAKN